MTEQDHHPDTFVKRRSLRREVTRARLLDAAISVFAAHGYADATIDSIAEAAGLSKGAIYFHFSSKEEVFLTVLWLRVHDEEQRLRDALDKPVDRPLEHLLRQVVAYLSLDERNASWPPLITEFWSHAGRNPRVREAVTAVAQYRRQALLTVLEAAVVAGVVRPNLRMDICTDMLLTLGDGLVARAGSGQPLPASESLVAMIAYTLGVSTVPTSSKAAALTVQHAQLLSDVRLSELSG
jgi:AcrR family transcriptional regulator